MRRERVDAFVDLDEQGGDVVVVKWQSTTEHDIQDHATAPYINFGTRVQPARDDLWRCIVGTAAAGLEEVAVHHEIREAKIADLDVEEFIQ